MILKSHFSFIKSFKSGTKFRKINTFVIIIPDWYDSSRSNAFLDNKFFPVSRFRNDKIRRIYSDNMNVKGYISSLTQF